MCWLSRSPIHARGPAGPNRFGHLRGYNASAHRVVLAVPLVGEPHSPNPLQRNDLTHPNGRCCRVGDFLRDATIPPRQNAYLFSARVSACNWPRGLQETTTRRLDLDYDLATDPVEAVTRGCGDARPRPPEIPSLARPSQPQPKPASSLTQRPPEGPQARRGLGRAKPNPPETSGQRRIRTADTAR